MCMHVISYFHIVKLQLFIVYNSSPAAHCSTRTHLLT
jgi:hypothetical protein